MVHGCGWRLKGPVRVPTSSSPRSSVCSLAAGCDVALCHPPLSTQLWQSTGHCSLEKNHHLQQRGKKNKAHSHLSQVWQQRKLPNVRQNYSLVRWLDYLEKVSKSLAPSEFYKLVFWSVKRRGEAWSRSLLRGVCNECFNQKGKTSKYQCIAHNKVNPVLWFFYFNYVQYLNMNISMTSIYNIFITFGVADKEVELLFSGPLQVLSL